LPLHGPSLTSSLPHAPVLRPTLAVPPPPQPSSFAGRSGSYGNVGPALPCNLPNSCKTSSTAISSLRLDLRHSPRPIPSTLSDPPSLCCVLLLPTKTHSLLIIYSPSFSPPLSPSPPATYWKSSSTYHLGLLPALLDGPMPP
jgi:hypothetical protein